MSTPSGIRRSAPALRRTLRELGTLLSEIGAPHLILMDESNAYPPHAPGRLDAAGWTAMIALLREARSLLADEFGVTLTFHPHVGTAVELEPQIDRLLDATDIDLCFDTGHHAFWDQDPLAYMTQVQDRIGYMHLRTSIPPFAPACSKAHSASSRPSPKA